ncbi:uncharacterized protein [Diabrotica undecimpunctata]|uniref:uncharacterized protein isoform X4 n=1 Tax=Diabrotica undecimpunctata TaxID=50387 RepID=UPI003B6324A3
MEIKPEVNDNSCKMEIDNNVVGDGLRDIFTKNIKEEPKIESINDSFDYLDLQEYHVKTEIEQDEHKLIPRNLILFEEKQTNDKAMEFKEEYVESNQRYTVGQPDVSMDLGYSKSESGIDNSAMDVKVEPKEEFINENELDTEDQLRTSTDLGCLKNEANENNSAKRLEKTMEEGLSTGSTPNGLY